jgi:hypothetical protein
LKPLLVIALVIAAGAATIVPSSAQQAAVAGAVIVARAGTNALILWDATPDVVAAGNSTNAQDKTLVHFELLALEALRQKAAALPNSKLLTIRMLYDRTGAVSAVYHIATMEGTEHVFDLTAPRDEITTKFGALSSQISAGKVVPPAQLQITGSLPGATP